MRTANRPACATLAVLLCGLACSAPLRADRSKPEALLSGKSVAYFRFDGLADHQAELDKTIFAQLLAKDLHPLLSYLKTLALDAAGPDVVAKRLLAGAEPDRLIELQKSAKQMPLLVQNVVQHGLLAGIETAAEPLPGGQVTLVFPGAGRPEYREAVFAAVRILGVIQDLPVSEVSSDGRQMLKISTGPASLACWQEGDHVVSTFGLASPEKVIELAEGGRVNLTANPLFTQLGEFREYDTYARGFIDTKRAIDFTRGIVPPVAQVFDEIGLSGLTSVTLHLGCRDELLRSTVVLHTTEDRKELLAAFSAAGPLKVEQLPPLPPDAAMVVAASLDAGAVYESLARMVETVVQAQSPGASEVFKSQRQKFEEKLGGDVRSQLNAAFGSNVLLYTSASEGTMFFSVALAMQVKDETKLHDALERLFRTLAELAGAEVDIRRQPYRDGALNVIEFDAQAFPFSPTYAVHDGWFVIGFTPQAAQGLILRSSGQFKTWQPGAVLKRAQREADARRAGQEPPASVLAVAQIDPRPTVATILSYSSFFLAISRSAPFGEGVSKFDPTLIPHSQAITERLSPNAAVVLDDGKSIRIDSYDTLPMPLDISAIGGAFAPPFLFGF